MKFSIVTGLTRRLCSCSPASSRPQLASQSLRRPPPAWHMAQTLYRTSSFCRAAMFVRRCEGQWKATRGRSSIMRCEQSLGEQAQNEVRSAHSTTLQANCHCWNALRNAAHPQARGSEFCALLTFLCATMTRLCSVSVFTMWRKPASFSLPFRGLQRTATCTLIFRASSGSAPAVEAIAQLNSSNCKQCLSALLLINAPLQ
jgi:hypothetical protein